MPSLSPRSFLVKTLISVSFPSDLTTKNVEIVRVSSVHRRHYAEIDSVTQPSRRSPGEIRLFFFLGGEEV